MPAEFKGLSTEAGLKELDAFLETHSYIEGVYPSQADVTVYRQLNQNLCRDTYPHAVRFYNHIASFCECARKSWPGERAAPAAPAKAEEKKAPAKTEEKKAAAPAKTEEKKAAAAPAKKKPASDDEDEAPKKKKPASDDEDEEDDDKVAFSDDEDDEETKAMFAKKKEEVERIQARQQARAGEAKSNLTLDVKPLGSDTDMAQVEKYVRGLEIEGVKWLGSSLIDIAYGVKKLRIMCQLVDVLVNPDTVRESIEQCEDVQSTDIFAFQMA